MITKAINKLKSDNGSGLVLSLMVLLVLSVLGSALGVVTVGSHRLSDINRDSTSAYYIAESGANMAYEEIKKDLMAIYEAPGVTSEETYYIEINKILKTNTTYNYREYNTEQFKTQLGDSPKSKIRVEESKNLDGSIEYTLISTGEVAGKSRTVEKPVWIEWVSKGNDKDLAIPVPPVDAAIVVKENLTATDNLTVLGKIYYHDYMPSFDDLTDNMFKDSNDWDSYSVNITTPQIPPIKNIKELKELKQYKAGTTILTEDSYIEKLEVKNDFKIDTKGNSVSLVVNEIYTENANIEVIGDGNLTIYHIGYGINLQNGFIFNGSLISNEAITANNVNITGDVVSSKSINFGNNSIIKGNIISHGSITLDNAEVIGDILGKGEIKLINSGANVTGDIVSSSSITADNATIIGNVIAGGDVKMTNNDTDITGNVVSKGKIFLGNATVNGIIISEKDITLGNDKLYTTLIVAPNGTVKTGTQTKVEGSIIAKNIDLNNNNEITYSDSYLGYLPDKNLNDKIIEISDLISTSPAIEQ